MKSIQELTTHIEELEKRIKALSNSLSSQTNISIMKDSLLEIKAYLSELNSTFDTHLQDVENYDEDISTIKSTTTNLQTQISTLEQTIENLQSPEFDSSQIEGEISTLQTELSLLQDELSTLNGELSTTNQAIGEHTTTLTNLQTTQTNLQTTQSSQASTLNNLNNRLTTCENNVNSLTGGVDLSEFEQRLDDLEKGLNVCSSQEIFKIPLNFVSTANKFFYPLNISISHRDSGYVSIEGNIEHNEVSEYTTIHVYLALDGNIEYSTNKNIANAGTNFAFKFNIKLSKDNLKIELKVKTSKDLNLSLMNVSITGNDIYVYDFSPQYHAYCFDNQIYLTKLNDNTIQFGKFTSDSLNINSLPHSITRSNFANGCKHALFLPKPDSYAGEVVGLYTDALYWLNYNKTINIDTILDDGQTGQSQVYNTNMTTNCQMITTGYNNPFHSAVNRGKPVVYKLDSSSGSSYGSQALPNEKWVFCSCVYNNNLNSESQTKPHYHNPILARTKSGYMYFFYNSSSSPVKIARGISATGFIQPDESINIYVFDGFNMLKYILTKNENNQFSVSYSSKTEFCTSYYELYDNKALVCISNKWQVITQ
ncbi:MAG: hypothetical protein E7378_04795 [Clostridiales bacterium]|nr:hypothetical protein [Clostridiales bacterium]